MRFWNRGADRHTTIRAGLPAAVRREAGPTPYRLHCGYARSRSCTLTRGADREPAAPLVRCVQVYAPATTPPPPTTAAFASDIDNRVLRAFCVINHVEESLDASGKQLYETPLVYGGLGMRPLAEHRAAAFIGGWMQVLAHVRANHGPTLPGFDAGWNGLPVHSYHRDYTDALEQLDSQLGQGGAAYSITGLSLQDLLGKEAPKTQKELSRAVAAQKYTQWRATLDEKGRAAGVLAGASAEGRRTLASEFLTSTPSTRLQTIPDNNYRILIKMRLGLPVTLHGDMCKVRTTSNPRPCNKPLAAMADHAFACAKTARQTTHDSVADLNASYHHEAGNRAWREAAVPEASLTQKNKLIRADVLIRRGPIDPAECTEVKLRHPWKSNGDLTISSADQWDGYLRAEEQAITGKYSPVRVCPWVFTTLGRPGEQFCTDLRRLARERLGRADAQRAVSRESLRQLLLRRWRAQISCTIAIGVSNTVLDAIEGAIAGRDVTVPRETRLYDLQTYRFTGY